MTSLVCMAVITAPHGVHGRVRVKPFTDKPLATFELCDGDGTPVALTFSGLIASVDGVTTRNQAEALRGMKLYTLRHALPALEDNNFYHVDLIGLPVLSPQGTLLGAVRAIHNFGSSDILEVAQPPHPSHMIPFTLEAIPDIQPHQIIADPAFVLPAPGSSTPRP